MQEAAAVWLVWPCCCSPLLNQPDISGWCVHHSQRGPTLSLMKVLLRASSTGTQHTAGSRTLIIKALIPASLLVFSAFICCLMSGDLLGYSISDLKFFFFFCILHCFCIILSCWFWLLMDSGKRKHNNHLLSILTPHWNLQNFWRWWHGLHNDWSLLRHPENFICNTKQWFGFFCIYWHREIQLL